MEHHPDCLLRGIVVRAIRAKGNLTIQREFELKDRVLLTGAGGFIGSHLAEALLSEGCHVRAMVHYNFQNSWGWLDEVVKDVPIQAWEKTHLGVRCQWAVGENTLEVVAGDVQDPYFVDAAVGGCGTVFHLAALIAIPYSYVAPASYVSTNVQGTLNVLEACRRHKVTKLVHTSTSEVYGTAQYTPIDETHPVVGQSPYSASKIGADHLVESYCRSFDLPAAIIRPFNTFGPRQSARAVIPTIISQVLAGHEAVRLGSLAPVRDLNYVKDTVAGFLKIGASSASIGRVINIGRGEGVPVGEVARLILSICNSSALIEADEQRVRPEKSEVFKLVCDNSRARQALGWQPKYSLGQGLQETVQWFRSNLDRYKTGFYNV